MDWGSPQGHFLYATDNRALHQIVCGHRRIRDEAIVPLVTRVLGRIVEHMGAGWSPPGVIQDPVQWWKRDYNKVADGLADLTMDQRRTWTKRFDTNMPMRGSNIIVQTDGGRRDGDCAAAAWTIGLWRQTAAGPKFEPMIAHGTYLDTTCTVFDTEAIALGEASKELVALLSASANCVANG